MVRQTQQMSCVKPRNESGDRVLNTCDGVKIVDTVAEMDLEVFHEGGELFDRNNCTLLRSDALLRRTYTTDGGRTYCLVLIFWIAQVHF